MPGRAIIVPQEWEDNSPPAWEISEPFAKLQAKYCYADSSPSMEFDLYGAQRLQNPGWLDRIEGADLYATLLMNSRMKASEVDALLSHRRAIGQALASVPADLDLEAADLSNGELRQSLERLFALCRAPGVGLAKVTKFLCLKRPRLIPMLDSQVLVALYGDWWTGSKIPEEFAREALRAMCLFQKLMNWPNGRNSSNMQLLQSISAAFTRHLSQYLKGIGIDAPHPTITPVRVLDNLLWFDYGGYKYFGYCWNRRARRVEPVR